MTPAESEELAAHCRIVTRRLREGRVVAFLGAGANLCGRPTDADWRDGQYLPSGGELAAYLAESYAYPSREVPDLLRVSQYIQAVTGGTVLYEELHDLFSRHYEPNDLHHLLAAVPDAVRRWRDEGYDTPYQLIVTTNYDDALESAFVVAGEEFDLVTYVAKGVHRGKFMHRRADGTSQLIEEPNRYRELSLDTRTVILKIHGAVDRSDPSQDSYVITEDNYRVPRAEGRLQPPAGDAHGGDEREPLPLPRLQPQRLEPARDPATDLGRAAVRGPVHVVGDPVGAVGLEERLWRRRNVEILDVDLAAYVAELDRLFVAAGERASPP